MSEFKHDLVDIDENGDIVIVGKKTLYNTDENLKLRDFFNCVEGEKIVFPNFSNGLKIVEHNKKMIKNSIGTLHYQGNDVYNSPQGVFISSGVGTVSKGAVYHCSILSDNFQNVCCAFSARKLIDGNWINDKDEFLYPNEKNSSLIDFKFDSIIYSLFNSSSLQSSLRDIDYKDKKWNIKNQFFFMSNEEMKNLANENNNDEVYTDAVNDNEERFVYKFIEEHKNEFSKEAIEVLEKAKDLVKKSFKYRKFFNVSHEEYQINNWDAGWYQIKAMLKEYMSEDLKEFRDAYKNFSDKMRPMVYELGFLRK